MLSLPPSHPHPLAAALPRFWAQFSDWQAWGANNLAGTIAYIAGLVLWASSLTWVRRRFFEVGA